MPDKFADAGADDCGVGAAEWVGSNDVEADVEPDAAGELAGGKPRADTTAQCQSAFPLKMLESAPRIAEKVAVESGEALPRR